MRRRQWERALVKWRAFAGNVGVPCVALAGHAEESARRGKLFTAVRALTERASSQHAQSKAAILLEQLAWEMARDWNALL